MWIQFLFWKFQEEKLKLKKEACDEMHRFDQFKYCETIVADLEINRTNYRNWRLKEIVDDNANCKGELFESKSNLVVEADFEISLYAYESTIKSEIDVIILPSNTHCTLYSGHLIDQDDTQTYWEKPMQIQFLCHPLSRFLL